MLFKVSMLAQFVVCLKNKGYEASLELRKLYQALEDAEAKDLRQVRIIDESGEDYLYPEDWFVAVELSEQVKHCLEQAA